MKPSHFFILDSDLV